MPQEIFIFTQERPIGLTPLFRSGPNAAADPGPAEEKQRHQANGQRLAAGRPSTGENQDGHVLTCHQPAMTAIMAWPSSATKPSATPPGLGDGSLDPPYHPLADHLRRRIGPPPPSYPGVLVPREKPWSTTSHRREAGRCSMICGID
jgi:hypothetical protein